MTCTLCGAPFEGGSCGVCGTPAPQTSIPSSVAGPPTATVASAPIASAPVATATGSFKGVGAQPRNVPALVAGGVAGLALLVAGGIWLSGRNASAPDGGTTPTAPAAAAAAGVATTSAAAPSMSAAPLLSPTPTVSTPPVDPEATARQELERRYVSDKAAFVTADQWLVQIDSKWVGITDDLQLAANGTHVFGASDILARYRDLASRYSPVSLLQSTDFGQQFDYPTKPPGEPLWVVIHTLPSGADRATAEAWCLGAFPGLSGDAMKNACLPRQAKSPWR